MKRLYYRAITFFSHSDRGASFACYKAYGIEAKIALVVAVVTLPIRKSFNRYPISGRKRMQRVTTETNWNYFWKSFDVWYALGYVEWGGVNASLEIEDAEETVHA